MAGSLVNVSFPFWLKSEVLSHILMLEEEVLITEVTRNHFAGDCQVTNVNLGALWLSHSVNFVEVGVLGNLSEGLGEGLKEGVTVVLSELRLEEELEGELGAVELVTVLVISCDV